MAKDRTLRGGRRVRAGGKPDALVDKIAAGKAAKVLEVPELHPETMLEADDLDDAADLYGADMPAPSDYLCARQKDGKPLGADMDLFDPDKVKELTDEQRQVGFTVIPFGQGFKDMSPPTRELMKLTLEERIAHGGQPVLRWMMDNIFVRTDPAGNIKPDKEKSTERIDGAVALIMALDRALRHKEGGSVYNGRGLLIL